MPETAVVRDVKQDDKYAQNNFEAKLSELDKSAEAGKFQLGKASVEVIPTGKNHSDEWRQYRVTFEQNSSSGEKIEKSFYVRFTNPISPSLLPMSRRWEPQVTGVAFSDSLMSPQKKDASGQLINQDQNTQNRGFSFRRMQGDVANYAKSIEDYILAPSDASAELKEALNFLLEKASGQNLLSSIIASQGGFAENLDKLKAAQNYLKTFNDLANMQLLSCPPADDGAIKQAKEKFECLLSTLDKKTLTQFNSQIVYRDFVDHELAIKEEQHLMQTAAKDEQRRFVLSCKEKTEQLREQLLLATDINSTVFNHTFSEEGTIVHGRLTPLGAYRFARASVTNPKDVRLTNDKSAAAHTMEILLERGLVSYLRPSDPYKLRQAVQ